MTILGVEMKNWYIDDCIFSCYKYFIFENFKFCKSYPVWKTNSVYHDIFYTAYEFDKPAWNQAQLLVTKRLPFLF